MAFLVLVFVVFVARAQMRQSRALSQVDESLDLSRRNTDNVERLLDLTQRSIKQQEEMVRLLRELAGREATGQPAFGGVRLPAGPPAPQG